MTTSTANNRTRCRRWNILNLYRCFRARRWAIVAIKKYTTKTAGRIFLTTCHIPFKAYIIHRRNPLRVNASGTMNNKSTSADVDSNVNSTMPMPYRTRPKQIRYKSDGWTKIAYCQGGSEEQSVSCISTSSAQAIRERHLNLMIRRGA